jgi:nucleotide-binding universal stress UspA family protein
VLEDIDEVETEIIEAEDTAAEIIERSEAHDVTVLGAPIKSALRRILFGSTPDAVGQQASGTVLVAKQGGGTPSSIYSRWKRAIGQSEAVTDERS